MNKLIKQIANSSSVFDVIRQGILKTGFELEYQGLDGQTSDDMEVDYDQIREDAHESWRNCDDKEDWLPSGSISDLLKELLNLTSSWYDAADCFKDTSLSASIAEVQEEAEDSFINNFEENVDHADYRIENTPECKYPIRCKEDSSVSGGEVTTTGAVTPIQFLETIKDLLKRNEFTIDDQCSFHIHLSVEGIKHTYGQELQAEMQAYILNTTLPVFLQERLTAASLRYYKPAISTDKYTLVSFCSRLSTWEFRIFGNVKEYSDAKYCLLLAIAALRHAYRVKCGLSKSLLDGVHSLEAKNTVLAAAAKLPAPTKGMNSIAVIAKTLRAKEKIARNKAA